MGKVERRSTALMPFRASDLQNLYDEILREAEPIGDWMKETGSTGKEASGSNPATRTGQSVNGEDWYTE